MPKIWETFLPVTDLLKTDLAPAADATYLLSKGVEPESPALLCLLRDEVHTHEFNLVWFSFLVHNRESGVPTTEDDKRCYVHLRMLFKSGRCPTTLSPPAPWQMTRFVDLSREIAGVDGKILDIDCAWGLIGEQSAWLLRLIESLDENADGLTLARHVRQYLHLFANMAQMRVT